MEPSIENPSIKTWLKRVISTNKKNSKSPEVFGVPLLESLKIANTSIAYEDKNTVIGSIPIVVAKCGSFLKDQGLYVEGVFRKSGSARRLGELQQQFNSSSDYGIGLNWRGYTVHDAANCLRRFLNYLPEPVIIISLYGPFRNVAAANNTNNSDRATTIKSYQKLIDQLPIVNQYLLFYLLDLLALFTQYSKYTKMDSMALASVFTPGILLNPDDAMNPNHYKLSQKVVQFLIENQHHFHLPRNNLTTTSEKNNDSCQSNAYPILASTMVTLSHDSTIDSTNSSTFRQQLLRANTVPAKQNRFGPNDPLQIINK